MCLTCMTHTSVTHPHSCFILFFVRVNDTHITNTSKSDVYE